MSVKLRPSARLNRRYLLVRGTQSAIERALLDYLGLLGWSRAAPVFIGHHDGRIILAVTREELIDVRAALGLASESLIIERVSGTLDGLGVRTRSS